ncbi:uncharacterized protein LOC130693434 [Daphnia carinata]|uniref:uncharacterized protein LOC130693434 n=1 Tax=Daphnia carinata TaxID=120202 RepID=UPI00257FE7F8|nr:uncharacterized protein LOC130693434 [Daphnia carinata]
MDALPAGDIGYIGESERRREGRLTSIIDQLLSSRATSTFGDAVNSDKRIKGKNREISSTSGRTDGTMSSPSAPMEHQPVQASANDNRPKKESVPFNTSSVKASLSNKARRKKVGRNTSPSANVKHERFSPDMETGTASSRSASPCSPISHSFRPPTPSTAETPNNSCVSPAERFSPGNYNASNNKPMSEGLQMSRNYSDFMRSLAAKYNNSNDYRSQQTNSLMSILDSRASCKDLIFGEGSSQSPPFPLFNLPLNTFTSHALAASKHYEMASALAETGKKERREFSTTPLLPLSGLGQDNSIRHALPPGFHAGPAMDMSSTQALLSIVRSATARGSPRIDPYISDTTTRPGPATLKRSSVETVAVASHIPLDLSASMAKRPYMDSQLESLGRSRFSQLSSSRSPAMDPNNIAGRQFPPIGRKSPPSRFSSDTINARGENKVAIQNKPAIAQLLPNCRLSCAAHSCSAAAVEVQKWSISHVVDFVKSIDICSEYAQAFEDQSIDGSTLPLLTEEHLITSMNMKLGPALKLRSVLANKIGHCAICLHCIHCHAEPTGVEQPLSSQDHQNLLNNS